MGIQHQFETPHHLRRLHGVCAGADLEVDVRMRQAKIGKQAVVHILVVVLPGVHKQRWQRRMMATESA